MLFLNYKINFISNKNSDLCFAVVNFLTLPSEESEDTTDIVLNLTLLNVLVGTTTSNKLAFQLPGFCRRQTEDRDFIFIFIFQIRDTKS